MKTPSKEEIKMFKVLVGFDKKNLLNMPTHIPWDMLNEEYAQLNHSQSLTRLNERGGLCVTEMLANIQKQSRRDWTVTQQTVDDLNSLVAKYYADKTPQSVEVMTLEELMDEHRLYMCGIKDMPTQKVTYSGAIKVAEIYASQYKSKADQLQAENIYLSSLLSELNSRYRFGKNDQDKINKALETTKQ